MAGKRKAISKKLRFEIFKRDSFTCQYCGKSAPDVVLNVDHINPVANGGGVDILNLITSCVDCNSGKSARLISDNSILEKQKKQLHEINERREQLKLMVQWREELGKLNLESTKEVEKIFECHTKRTFSEIGMSDIGKLIKKYGLLEVMESCEISLKQYLQKDKSGNNTEESINKSFAYISKICHVRQQSKQKPYLPELIKLRWLCKSHLWNTKEWEVMKVLESAYLEGTSVDDLRGMINDCGTWHSFKDLLSTVTGVYYG